MTAAMPVAPVPAAPRPSPSSPAALPPQSVLPSLLRRSHLLSNTIPLCFPVYPAADSGSRACESTAVRAD
jgi:hypothetical protein